MDETMATRYWCHMCSQLVNPIIEAEIKCPYCRDGFVEEMSSATREAQEEDGSDFRSERGLYPRIPVVRRRRRTGGLRFADEDDGEADDMQVRLWGDYSELGHDMDSIIQRRRSSAMILQLLQDLRTGMALGSENQSWDQDQDLPTNTFNRANSGGESSHDSSENLNRASGSLGDYFIGPSLDLLLQHLAENDPNRYGTPPAKKEAMEALPTVSVKEPCPCPICLDDLESEVKEMPCKHKFHGSCILPWLKLHSSCPVCRFQLAGVESKRESSRGGSGSRARDGESSDSRGSTSSGGEGRNRLRRFVISWPFAGSSTSSAPSANAGRRSSTADEQ